MAASPRPYLGPGGGACVGSTTPRRAALVILSTAVFWAACLIRQASAFGTSLLGLS